jgi:survival-of-motor-neuron-related-splicing factor 30
VYFGFGNRDELPAASLRAIDVDSAHSDLPESVVITEGFKCEAKYYVDSQYYTCSVTKVTAHGFQVLFDGYGNSEEVPYEYMRPAATAVEATATATVAATPAAAPTAGHATAKSATIKPAPAVVDKPIKIPENLQILPTDSEAEKERKRKRIRAIKSLNRHKNIDNERNLKQHDWKVFQHKATKKKVKGASGVLSKRGTSMFASPDSVNGRVGVVGSGQGMTPQFEDARKKLKRNPTAPSL